VPDTFLISKPANGDRRPSVAESQKRFIIGIYLLHRGRAPDAAKLRQAEGIEKMLIEERGCTPTTSGVFFYHWRDPGKTPANELADPAGSVARAAASAHTGGCNQFGLIPKGRFFGVTGCASESSVQNYARIERRSGRLLAGVSHEHRTGAQVLHCGESRSAAEFGAPAMK
jgi:hypothetical protein